MLFYYNLSFCLQGLVASLCIYIELFLQNKGYSHSLIGLIIALGQVASIIVPVLIAIYADKKDRSKWILLACTLAFYAFIIPTLLCKSVGLTIACYMVMMAFFQSLNPLTDGLLNKYNAGHPGGYSFMRATGTIGYVIMLVIFAIIKWPDQTNNKSILAGNTLFVILYSIAIILVPEKKEVQAKCANGQAVEKKEKFFDPKWFSKPVYVFTGIAAITRISQTVVDKLLSSYVSNVLGMSGNFTLMFALAAFSEFVMMIVGGRLLEKGKVKPQTLLKLCCIALVVRLMIYYLIPTVWGVAMGQLLHSFTFGAIHIATAAFYNKHVDKKHSGLAMTMYWALANYLPMMLGALAGGWIIDKWGYPTLFISYSSFAVIAYILCIANKKTLSMEA